MALPVIDSTKYTMIKADDFALNPDTLIAEIATAELAGKGVILPGYYVPLKVIKTGESAENFLGRFVVVIADTKLLPVEFDKDKSGQHRAKKFAISACDTMICDLEHYFGKSIGIA